MRYEKNVSLNLEYNEGLLLLTVLQLNVEKTQEDIGRLKNIGCENELIESLSEKMKIYNSIIEKIKNS